MARENGGIVFLATARGLGFETSVSDPCVYMLWPSTTLQVSETKSGNRPSLSLKSFHFWTL